MVSLIAACKGGFQRVPDAGSDALDAPEPPVLLGCKATRFSIDVPMPQLAGVIQLPLVKQVAVTPTPRGYHVFVVDGNNTLRGYSYEFAGNELVATARNVSLMANVTGSIAAVALPADASDRAEALLAVPCTATSTTLIALDSQLSPLTRSGTTPGVIHDGWLAGYGSLVSTDPGRLVFLAMKDGTTELYARAVSRLGVDEDAGSPHLLDLGSNVPSGATMIRAGTGYLVVWNAAGPVPDEVWAMMLDERLDVAAPATKISPEPDVTMENSNLPAVGYSAKSKVALFAWALKQDQIWFSLRDEQLKVLPPTIEIQPGNVPSIAASDDDFLVVWTDYLGTQELSAGRVALDGTLTRPGLSTTNGKAPGWDLVVRNSQPALVWLEDVTSGPYLWFDALCKP